MSSDWTEPEYVATVVGVLAVGSLVFYAELVSPTLTARTVVFVVLWVTLPMTVARVVARAVSGDRSYSRKRCHHPV